MVTATSIVSGPPDRLRRLVAASTTFQAVVGAIDAAAALPRVAFPQADVPDYPIAIVTADSSVNGRKVGTAMWAYDGDAKLTFYFEIDDALDTEDQCVTFGNSVGAIQEEMQALAGRGESVPGQSHLNVIGMNTDGVWREPVEEIEHDTLGDRKALWWQTITVEWRG